MNKNFKIIQNRVAAGGCVLLCLGMLCGCARSPEKRRDSFLAKGKELLQKQQYASAVLEFRNAAKAMPRDGEPYYYAGIALTSSGDLVNAVRSFQKAIELDPKNRLARLRLAQVLTNGDEPLVQDAEKTVTELLQTEPSNPEMLNTLAVADLRLGKTEDAVQSLQRALSQNPGQLSTSILLARTKLLHGDNKGAEEILKNACAASPKMAAAHLALGRFYLSQKRVLEAEQAVRRALQVDPKSPAAVRDLAVIENQTGRKKEAEQNFKQLAGLDLETYNSLYGLFLFSEGRREESVREFERLATDNPRSRTARTQLVVVYEAMHRAGDARRVLDRALKKNPRDWDALLQRGQMLLAARQYGEAEADLNNILKQTPDSAIAHYYVAKLHQGQGRTLQYRQDLSDALRLDRNLLGVRVELARELVSEGQANDALGVLDRAPDDQKKSPQMLAQRNWALWASGNLQEMRKGIDHGLAEATSPEFLIQDGVWKLRSGDAAAARASLEKALNIRPGDIRALAALKDTYLMQRQGALAVQKVKDYAAREPKSPAVQEFLGYMLLGSGDRAGARTAFGAAKAADPRDYGADLATVQLDVIEAKWDAAVERLRAVVAADPGNATACLWLADLQSRQGQAGAALENFRKVLAITPDNPQALNNFAYLLAEHAHKPDEALKYAEKAVQTAPGNPEYADTLGWILYRKGLYSAAVQNLQRAATGKDPVAKYHLAMAYAKTGDLKRARAAFVEAKVKNANLPEAAMTSAVLGNN